MALQSSASRTRRSSADYTVGWVCALRQEFDSACAMLDEEHHITFHPHGDNNPYVCGRAGSHFVVIVCLPRGSIGTNEAARTVRDMMRSFSGLRFALMVGIGGGAPTTENDVRRGDVVVSTPGRDHGGVIQHDMGKKLQDGSFQRTACLKPPPDVLLRVLQEMQGRLGDSRRPDAIAAHIARMQHRPEYRRPVHDELYQTPYLHRGGPDCRNCGDINAIRRPQRRSDRAIAVHYGTIASGNTLLRDPVMRDRYSHDPQLKVLCFEMESAGIMNQLPCLVIRGISDYADTHKNDCWHRYASLTAAAYARELLVTLSPVRVNAMPTLLGR